MDRGAWQATVLKVTKSWTQLSTNTNSLHLLFELFLAYPRFFLSSLEQEVLLIKSLYIVLGSRFMKPPKQKQTFLTLISSLCGH